jgi:trimethylamine--corrinoid protein Co-methyltransferase
MKGAKRRFKADVLRADEVEAIHESTLTLLERTGVQFDSGQAVKRLLANGASLREGTTNTLRFPRSMVEDAIRRIPYAHEFHARDPQNNIVWDREHLFAGGGGGNPEILDLVTGETRPSTLEDVEATTRLLDALENCHTVSCQVMATDVPPEMMVIKTTEAMIRNSSKCLTGYALDAKTTDVLADMWACVVGDQEELRKRKYFSIYVSPSSPLTYDSNICEVMIRSAERGIPIDIIPCPMCGGTSPVTIAGGLVQQNAELLAGLMLIQTENDGLPLLYSGRLSLMDPRTGRNIWAVPEMSLASAASVQIAHRYNLVADIEGGCTDSPRWDVQVGIERMMSSLFSAMSGADLMSGVGGAWDTCASFEMAVIDDEILANVFRCIEGMGVDADRMALDVIDAVGPTGDFLSQRHTMRYLREGELRLSPLFDKRTTERARNDGFRPLSERAREIVDRILTEHAPVPLDSDVDRDLSAIVKEASRYLR